MGQRLASKQETSQKIVSFWSGFRGPCYNKQRLINSQRMNNPFLNSNDIFSKIDSNNKKPSFNPPPRTTPTDKASAPNYYARGTNENAGTSIYSPLVSANYTNLGSQRHFQQHTPLSPVNIPFNRQFKPNSYPKHEYIKEPTRTQYNQYGDYGYGGQGFQTGKAGLNKYPYGPTTVQNPYDDRYKDETVYSGMHQQVVSSYSNLKQSDHFRSNSLYSPKNTGYESFSTLQTTQLKASTFQLTKIDKQLTRYLSNQHNLAEISKLFGIQTPVLPVKEKAPFEESFISKPSRKASNTHTVPTNNQPMQGTRSRQQNHGRVLETEQPPFLIMGQEDENFDQEQDEVVTEVFNCSFMNLNTKNKGQLFRVCEGAFDGNGLSIRKALQKEIQTQCSRGDVRVMLTGAQKIRVKKYPL